MKKLLPSLRYIALPIISVALVALAVIAPQPACAQNLATPESVELKITRHYLNIPIGHQARMKLIELHAGGKLQRELPLQLAEDTIGYWVYIDVSAFKGQKITLSGTVSRRALQRIYQDDQINGADSLYKEGNRPQFHFTVKRGWNNDINGPIFYNGQYHLFWQSFPFGLIWNTGFMYWGHAVSTDLLHWQELDPALLNDSLGSPWSGTAVVDRNNDGGWGKNALVLYYACFDRVSDQEVQCIAYSTDSAKTFQHYKGNPIINSDWELGTTSTRDPKVFWYAPARTWVMLLFEKDGMSFFNSTDMRHWTRESHVPGLWECPDFFELPVDGDTTIKKWVIHGGSSEYMIGSFDGKTFTPETPKLRYAEGKNVRGEDCLYAAESFSNMPDGRVVQMAWGRIFHPGMPFSQMILFPTEFTLHRTDEGIRLQANPISEIDHLHSTTHQWTDLTAQQANQQLASIHPGPLHIRMTVTLPAGNNLHLRYQGNALLDLAATDLRPGANEIEILLDKTVAEIFINKGQRYIIHQLPPPANNNSLEFDGEKYGPAIRSLQVYEMKSVWER
jgi:fructan beta-fructosidase